MRGHDAYSSEELSYDDYERAGAAAEQQVEKERRANLPPLTPTKQAIDPEECAGTWFLIALLQARGLHVSSFGGAKKVVNAKLVLEWDKEKKHFGATVSHKSTDGKGKSGQSSKTHRVTLGSKDGDDCPADWRWQIGGGFSPLKQSFFVAHRADDYSHLLLGSPERAALWMLSRSSATDAAQMGQMVAAAGKCEYHELAERLQKVAHEPDAK